MKSWIETYLDFYPQDKKVKILYAEFMFNKFRNHQIALKTLGEIEHGFLFMLDRYKAYQLKMKIAKFIKKKNKESYKGKLEIQTALYVEEQITLIKNNIQTILKNNCRFWNLLARNTIDLQEINKLLKQQFADIDRTKELWITMTLYLDYKKKWKFYYAWYTLYILNKKIQTRILDNFQGTNVNENDIFSEEIQENNMDDDLLSLDSQPQDLVQDKINIKNKRIVFDKKACVIHTNDDPAAMILKVNKQFTRIFGYQKDEVENKLAKVRLYIGL